MNTQYLIVKILKLQHELIENDENYSEGYKKILNEKIDYYNEQINKLIEESE